MTAGTRSRRKRSEKELTLDERVALVLKLVAEHHGVAPGRISQPHRDEIRRIASGIFAFEEQRKQDAAVDAAARSAGHAQRIAPTLETALRTLERLPPEWWLWASGHWVEGRWVGGRWVDRGVVLDAVKEVQALCAAISKDPGMPPAKYAFAQRMAVQGAERVCDVCDVPKSLTKGSPFLRIAAALHGDPLTAGAMQKHGQQSANRRQK